MPICAFCHGETDEKTRDHVPPLCLFGDNPGDRLITVPACRKCNGGTSKDDEYFCQIAVDENIDGLLAAADVSESLTRAIDRPQAKGFRKLVLGAVQIVERRTESGLYGGRGLGIVLKMDRLMKTVEKTLRGLYFHVTNHPVPKDWHVNGVPLTDECAEALAPPTREAWAHVLAVVKDEPPRTTHDEVFNFRYFLDPDSRGVALLLEFYRRFRFLGLISPPAAFASNDTTTAVGT